jgi:hypothetical protein
MSIKDLPKLPRHPSTLLRVAIDDWEKVARTPGYKMDLLSWHEPADGACYVCFAGACMAGTLGANPALSLCPERFGADSKALFALDRIRKGYVVDFLELLNRAPLGEAEIDKLYELFPGGYAEVHPVKVGTKGAAFIRDMKRIAAQLESIGW